MIFITTTQFLVAIFWTPSWLLNLPNESSKIPRINICLNGATLMQEGYSKLIFSQSQTGWCDTNTDYNKNQIPDQEEASSAIVRHYVWPECLRVLPDGRAEDKCGNACVSDSDCKSKSKDDQRQGKCVTVYRAFCQEPCDYLRYRVKSQGVYPLSSAAIAIMASQELSWVTFQITVAPDLTTRWRPRSNNTYIDEPACFTDDEARSFVTTNYAMVNLYYENFDQTVVTEDASINPIDTVTLAATIGGNLGLCAELSIMTIVEWFELGAFALLSMPFFFFGIKLPYIKRIMKREEMPVDVVHAHMALVLKNVKKIYSDKNTSNSSLITAQFHVGCGLLRLLCDNAKMQPILTFKSLPKGLASFRGSLLSCPTPD